MKKEKRLREEERDSRVQAETAAEKGRELSRARVLCTTREKTIQELSTKVSESVGALKDLEVRVG